MGKHLMVISNSNNPYYNHAIELILFEKYASYEDIFFLWLNEPSVVIGRNQNPWRELDVAFCNRGGIHVVRRQSGGGTVFHDQGNVNFSFIKNHRVYDEKAHFDLIVQAIESLGIHLEVSSRKDLMFDGKKVSGNAFYLKGNRRMHHGTLLIDADLKMARKVLKAKDDQHQARFSNDRTIPSVPSPIVNLKEIEASLTPKSVMGILSDTFFKENAYDVDFINDEAILALHEKTHSVIKSKLSSWAWVYGETPNFDYQIEEALILSIKSGMFSNENHINARHEEHLYNNQFRR